MLLPYPPMTPLEKRKVNEIIAYEQPKCPGCGRSMKLGLEAVTETGNYRYRAWYWCCNCHIWRIDSSYGYTANQAAENAYKNAMWRKET